MEKLRLNIDGIEVTGYPGQTILEVAGENGINIPTFCFDKRLEIYGSCGICVVEAEGSAKLLRSCATEISDGMVIKTNTPRVEASRKINLELLLTQHIGDCRAPCVLACPAGTDCQGYVGLIANGEYDEAIRLIKDKIPLAASIGRVCPHPCEEACRRKLADEPVSILNLKRYAADLDLAKVTPYLPDCAPSSGKRVAIIGGGPGGLSGAWFIAQNGHAVTVFDAMPKMGGMLRYGIPEYRLPKEIIDKETALIEKLGVTFRNNVRVGSDVSFESLRREYDAVLVAVGAWVSTSLRCPGEELGGVYGGIDFLRKAVQNEPLYIGKKVAVVGGGNTAMDACRTAIRLGAENVYNIYRRTKAEMPAEEIEITEAEEEGVEFKYLVNPVEIINGGHGRLSGMRLAKMRLGDPDASGRRKPEAIPGEFETLEVDTVIIAAGQGINPSGFKGLELTKYNTIIADETTFKTALPGVFAIGDCVNSGASIAIAAIGHAKKAALSVCAFLEGGECNSGAPYRVRRFDLTEDDFKDRPKEHRSRLEHISPESRRGNFLETTKTYDCVSADHDAKRCLECGCHDFFECKLINLAERHNAEPDRFKESERKVIFSDDHPFIVRDPNKCILCGLCVRMCDEVVGSAALGFVGRGFETVVKPAFGDPLAEGTCISCGQCISVCPTGALQERNAHIKPVPVKTEKTDTICALCSVGCSSRVESVGGTIVKTLPADGRGLNDGVMCGRGRFVNTVVQSGERITTPMIRRDGVLTPVSRYEAFVLIAKKLEGCKLRGEKTAVAIGHSLSYEDAHAVLEMAKCFESETFSFIGRENGLARVLGCDAAPNTLEEVLSTNHIIVFGETCVTNPVILSKLRRAVRRGAEVTVIAQSGCEFNLECRVVSAENTVGFVRQINKALFELGCAARGASGVPEYRASLDREIVSEDARRIALEYKSAKKSMVLYALGEVSPECAAEIANMSVISGHIGAPRDGIYMVRPQAGSQALADLGVTNGKQAADGAKALVIFGEDPDALPEGLEFLAVSDTHLTDTAKQADVVLPMPSYFESSGTYINTEGREQCTVCAVKSPFECGVAEAASGIAGIVEHTIVPVSAPVRQTSEFKPRLVVTKDAPMFDNLAPASYLIKTITAKLPNAKR